MAANSSGVQTDDLTEAAVEGTNFPIGPQEHYTLFEPFNDVEDFGKAMIRLPVFSPSSGKGSSSAPVPPPAVENRACKRMRVPFSQLKFRQDFLGIPGLGAGIRAFASQDFTRGSSLAENKSTNARKGF